MGIPFSFYWRCFLHLITPTVRHPIHFIITSFFPGGLIVHSLLVMITSTYPSVQQDFRHNAPIICKWTIIFFGTKAYELNSLYWIIHRVKIHTCNACRKTTLNSPTFQRIWPQWSRSTVIEFVVWLQETTGTDCWLYVTSVGRHSENGVWCEFSANRYRTRSSASLRAITNILFSSRTSSIEPTKKTKWSLLL